ncbi:DUF1285 domain-containing protein [Granulosicoccus sp. 3-233]|uniref:DUF1285 domain-containing protein n=1 Tax=Granulosicoccus sp. 3-233 TaxID=3417969 RepID=UPI003D34B062
MSESGMSYLTAIVDALSTRSLPPVNSWQPDITRDIDMRIARNGDWFYEGSRIDRSRMVRLFSSVLRMDGDDTYLVTPQERLRIVVEDAPFTAVLVERRREATSPELVFTTNLGEQVVADEQHPIQVRYERPDDEPAPYVLVRDRLQALISRAVFLELATMAEERDGRLGVLSCGCFMPLDAAADE